MTNKVIYILNGPNLNLLGRRETDIYGTESMESVMLRIQRQHPDIHFRYLQSNHEGDLIDWLQEAALSTEPTEDGQMPSAPVSGVILNAGGYTHTSVAIRDAVSFVRERNIPVVEVHISDITRREAFRQVSLLTDVCSKTILGQGTIGYDNAVNYIIGCL